MRKQRSLTGTSGGQPRPASGGPAMVLKYVMVAGLPCGA